MQSLVLNSEKTKIQILEKALQKFAFSYKTVENRNCQFLFGKKHLHI